MNSPTLRTLVIIFAFLSFGIGTIIFLYGFIILIVDGSMFKLADLSNIGQFYSGTVIAFYTISTIAFIIVAFINQNTEIDLQKTANKTQKDEIDDNKKEVKFNRFENTYFKLVDLYQSIINGMKISRYRTGGAQGGTGITARNTHRETFETLYLNDLKPYINTYSVGATRIAKIRDGYKKFDKVFQDNLGNYFRNLYAILKFIKNNVDNGTITLEQSYFYIITIRGQLSKYELLILFYNGLSEYGDEAFRELLIEMRFFKHISREDLCEVNDYNEYPEYAYDLPEA